MKNYLFSLSNISYFDQAKIKMSKLKNYILYTPCGMTQNKVTGMKHTIEYPYKQINYIYPTELPKILIAKHNAIGIINP